LFDFLDKSDVRVTGAVYNIASACRWLADAMPRGVKGSSF